jgi:hypothetical protein
MAAAVLTRTFPGIGGDPDVEVEEKAKMYKVRARVRFLSARLWFPGCWRVCCTARLLHGVLGVCGGGGGGGGEGGVRVAAHFLSG